MLRDEGGLEYKAAIADAIIIGLSKQAIVGDSVKEIRVGGVFRIGAPRRSCLERS